jgi:hypothetical protein
MKKPNQKGFIVPIILITFFLILTSALYILDLSVTNNKTANQESARVNAQFAADSGLDIGIQNLNADETWTGLSETVLSSNTKTKTTYQISVADGATTSKKTILAIGRVYSPASSATALVTRKYQLDVQAVTSGIGLTSVVSGVGGLVLNNNSRITGGDVVVNGTITVNNNAQIGLSTTDYVGHPEQVVNIRVAHISCPVPASASYPRVCGAGENGEPIRVTGKIYGDVRATNQTTATNMLNPGLTTGVTVAPYTLPDYDRAAQKSAVTTTLAPSDPSLSCGNNQSKTWPANLKITGDVSAGNNCTITVSGDVWITGNITMGNGAKFIVANSLALTRPTMMVDGQLGMVFGNNNTIQQNISGTGMYVLTYWCGASCSPDTNPVTGIPLSAAQTALTLDLSNNSSAPGSILYARWSKVRISNNGSIGAVAGQTIELGSNAIINFTSSVPGSSNLTKTWVKRGYLRTYN